MPISKPLNTIGVGQPLHQLLARARCPSSRCTPETARVPGPGRKWPAMIDSSRTLRWTSSTPLERTDVVRRRGQQPRQVRGEADLRDTDRLVRLLAEHLAQHVRRRRSLGVPSRSCGYRSWPLSCARASCRNFPSSFVTAAAHHADRDVAPTVERVHGVHELGRPGMVLRDRDGQQLALPATLQARGSRPSANTSSTSLPMSVSKISRTGSAAMVRVSAEIANQC